MWIWFKAETEMMTIHSKAVILYRSHFLLHGEKTNKQTDKYLQPGWRSTSKGGEFSVWSSIPDTALEATGCCEKRQTQTHECWRSSQTQSRIQQDALIISRQSDTGDYHNHHPHNDQEWHRSTESEPRLWLCRATSLPSLSSNKVTFSEIQQNTKTGPNQVEILLNHIYQTCFAQLNILQGRDVCWLEKGNFLSNSLL